MAFACNAVNLGKTIVLNCISSELEQELRGRGFEVIQVRLDEFLKAGGAAKCLVMKLTPEIHAKSEAREVAEQGGGMEAELIAMEEEYGAHNYHPLDVVIDRAQGAWVTDVNGRRYLDFLAAYSAVNQGHCHPKILAAMVEQAQKVTLTSRAFRNDQLPLLLRELHELTGFEMALPMNSGAEAVETALKAARKWGETVKGIEAESDGDYRLLRITFTGGRFRLSGSLPMSSIVRDSVRFRRDSSMFRLAMPRRFGERLRRRRRRSWWSRSRVRLG